MNARQLDRIEQAIDVVAAAIFAVAAACAALRLGPAPAAAVATAAFFASLHRLRSIEPAMPKFELGGFEIVPLPDMVETEELLLADADRLDPLTAGDGELVLDDVLTELSEDSRVVRLFDPAAMPTPGELVARIDRHLDNPPAAAFPDASKALHEALFELRKTLR
jgi:hypothetical protein